MKALVCALLLPAALAVWVLGSPRTAWRVIAAFRRSRDTAPAQGTAYQVLRIVATLALAAIVVLIILVSRTSD